MSVNQFKSKWYKNTAVKVDCQTGFKNPIYTAFKRYAQIIRLNKFL